MLSDGGSIPLTSTTNKTRTCGCLARGSGFSLLIRNDGASWKCSRFGAYNKMILSGFIILQGRIAKRKEFFRGTEPDSEGKKIFLVPGDNAIAFG